MGGETGRAQIFLEIYALKNFHSWIVAYFLSLIEMKNGNIKMALSYLDKSLSLCSNNENRKNLASVYKKLLSVKMDDSAINSVIFMKYRVDLSKVNIDEQSRPETVLELRK